MIIHIHILVIPCLLGCYHTFLSVFVITSASRRGIVNLYHGNRVHHAFCVRFSNHKPVETSFETGLGWFCWTVRACAIVSRGAIAMDGKNVSPGCMHS